MQPTILVIVGISGDLVRRKILPAIIQMYTTATAPLPLHIIGVTRQKDFHIGELEGIDVLREHFTLHTMDYADAAGYGALEEKIKNIEKGFDQDSQRLYYLSIPPNAVEDVITSLGKSPLASYLYTKILVEKPFGRDFLSAGLLMSHVEKYFTPHQIYRIDHYLAKPSLQEMTAFFSTQKGDIWNNEHIERIEISATESIGIERRALFYEQTGALRDMVQSHLLELCSVILLGMNDITASRRARQLEQLSVMKDNGVLRVMKGQYVGYTDDVDNKDSLTETFVELSLESKDPHWVGVPIIITTGKKMDKKATTITVTFKKEHVYGSNNITIQLDPCFAIDQLPSSQFHAMPKSDAYEAVLRAAILGDRNLFISDRELLASWKVLEPILQHTVGIKQYNPGASAIEIIESI